MNSPTWPIRGAIIAAIGVTTFTAGCSRARETPAVHSARAADATPITTDWSAAERERFYHLPTGGGYMPLAWFGALETTAVSGKTFAEDLSRFGWLADRVSDQNPYGLPVGMTVDTVAGVRIVGLNCAACHTGELRYRGSSLRVDGGPGMADPFGYIVAVQTAVKETTSDAARRTRFLRRVLEFYRNAAPAPATANARPTGLAGLADRLRARGKQLQAVTDSVRAAVDTTVADLDPDKDVPPSAVDRATGASGGSADARDVVQQTLTSMLGELRMLKTLASGVAVAPQVFASATTPFGFGRVDALGIGANLLFGTIAGNIQPADGPTSIPHLWGFQHTAWLHWGSNTNSVIERNIAQSLGTGGMFELKSFYTNVRLDNLHTLEELAYTIHAPAWPEATLGAIDRGKAERGHALYATKCASCHDKPLRTTATGLNEYQLFSLDQIKTDPNTARNFERRVKMAPNQPAIPVAAAVTTALVEIKQRYYLRNKISTETQAIWEGRTLRPLPQWASLFRSTMGDSEKYDDSKGGKVYAARPLAGIWASPPYLHNASVPTLYHLLLPAVQRPKTFVVGQLEYDPAHLGYQLEPTPAAVGDRATFTFDTSLSGNSNAGHEYGTALGDAQRMELIEYLKTVGAGPAPPK